MLLLCFFLDGFTVRNGGSLILHTCFYCSVEWYIVVSSSRFIFLVFLSFKMLPSLSSSNLFLLFILSFLKMEPSFTRIHIVLWQVFQQLISFSVLYFFFFEKNGTRFFKQSHVLLSMHLSAMESAAKEEMYICI